MESIINNVIDTMKDIIFDILIGTFYLPFKSIIKEGLPRKILVTDQQIVPFTCIQLH